MKEDHIILEIYFAIDEKLRGFQRKADSIISIGEIVTIGILFALKGKKKRQFYRWLSANQRHNFPVIPDRTRLFRLMEKYSNLNSRFLGEETTMGIIDSYGIELLHPMREGRSDKQVGKKGKSNHRWIVGMKYVPLVNQTGEIVDWEYDSANVHDKHFRDLIKDKQMLILADSGFHGKYGDPENMKICKKGQWNDRFMIESVFSRMSTFMNLKHLSERSEKYFEATLAYVSAAFNLVLRLFGSFANLSL
jgi:hypothetical protein